MFNFLAHVELPLSLLSPPTAPAASNSASSSTQAAGSNPVPVVSVKKDTKKKHHLTTATDPLFAELRDLNFSSVGKKLNKVARRLDEDYKVGLRMVRPNLHLIQVCSADEPADENGGATERLCWKVRRSSN